MRSTPLLLTEKVASYTQYRTSKVMYMNEEIYPTANTFSARLNLALKFNVTSRFGSENYQVMNYGLGGTIISHLDSTGKLLYMLYQTHALELSMAVAPEVLWELICNFQNKIITKKSDNGNVNVKLFRLRYIDFMSQLIKTQINKHKI